MTEQHVAVAIVGGGPSGLTAAAALAGRVDGEVLVIEREAETGGIPRHSDHLGYGMRDLKRFISGPAYARRLTAMAQDAGATLDTEAMVTGWVGERRLQVTSPRGHPHRDGRRGGAGHRRARTAPARAPGARRPPRRGVHHRATAEPRPSAPCTTIGSRALIVGAELVSWSAVLTLARSRLRHSRNGQRLSALGVLRGVSSAGPVTDATGRCSPAAGSSASSGKEPGARRGGGEHRNRRAHDGRLRHGRHHRRLDPRPRTGPHRRPGDGPRDARTAGRRRPSHQLRPGCSRSATCCTRSTPPTAPRWTDAMSPPPSAVG